MIFTDAELAVLESNTQRVGVFFRLATDSVVRLWLGIGRIKPGVNQLDPVDGGVYYGFGELVDVPAFQQLTGGTAERVDFSLSGVSQKTLALAAVDAPTVKQRSVAVGLGIMAPEWKLLAPVHWCWRGTADFLQAAVVPAADETGQTTRSITLSVGSLFTGRRRRGLSFYTDMDQQRASPGDTFCENTVKIAAGSDKVWPPG